MKTFPIPSVPALAALLALPLPAQRPDEDREETAESDVRILLIANDARTIALGDHRILDDAVLWPGQRERRVRFDLDARRVASDLFVQEIVWDARRGLRVGTIHQIQASRRAWNGDADEDGRADHTIVRRVRPATADAPPPAPPAIASNDTDLESRHALDSDEWARLPICVYDPQRKRRDNGLTPASLPIALQLVRLDPDAGGQLRLLASFEAPSNDYGLALIDVIEHEGAADVYLYRKVPGPGEGLLDIVEHHALLIDLPRTPRVNVFLAEGTGTRPQGRIEWRAIAKLLP